jgi:hypothetical protein
LATSLSPALAQGRFGGARVVVLKGAEDMRITSGRMTDNLPEQESGSVVSQRECGDQCNKYDPRCCSRPRVRADLTKPPNTREAGSEKSARWRVGRGDQHARERRGGGCGALPSGPSKRGGNDVAAPSRKTHQRPSYEVALLHWMPLLHESRAHPVPRHPDRRIRRLYRARGR